MLLRNGYIDQEKIVPKTENLVYFYNLSASSLYVVDVFTNGIGNQKNKESTYVVFGKSHDCLLLVTTYSGQSYHFNPKQK